MRLGAIAATALSLLAIGGPTAIHVAPWLIWNASASTPVGLYLIQPANRLEATDLLAVRPPELIADFMAARHYLPFGVPLLKRVLALPGQTVCRAGRSISVDGIDMGVALESDHLGRPMPVWENCRKLADGEIFLMNWQVPDSVDGRYFGPFPAASIIGRAVPLWTDEDGDGHFEWFAPTR